MYGVIYGNDVVAVHDDYNTISEFVDKQPNRENFSVVKIKKKHLKKYSDLYLIRYHDNYIPYNLYGTLKELSEEYTADYSFCVDILYRLLEDKDDLKPKEIKAISKVISILKDEIDNDMVSGDLETLREIKEMHSMFKERINENE